MAVFSLSPATAVLAAAPGADTVRDEVVISADREADEQLRVKVENALQDDPYVFAAHVEIQVRDGVIFVSGSVPTVQDLRSVLRLARRVAGRRRVVNSLELDLEDDVGLD